jgi:hypothetical protein
MLCNGNNKQYYELKTNCFLLHDPSPLRTKEVGQFNRRATWIVSGLRLLTIRASCKGLARANAPAYLAGRIVIKKSVFLTLKHVNNDIKHFSSLLTHLANKLEFWSIGKPLQLGFMFVGEAGA